MGERRVPIYPYRFTPDIDHVTEYVHQTAEKRAEEAVYRERRRDLRGTFVPAHDPSFLAHAGFEHWLWAVEDACLLAGRRYQIEASRYRRPHWRFWEFSQRMAWKFIPQSRVRQLLEPGNTSDEAGYRREWISRRPEWPAWDFVLRLLWFYARDSRLRHLLAPDKPAEP